MRAASYQSSSYRAQASPYSRIAAFALALGLIAAILLALLWLGAGIRRERDPGRGLTTFDVAGDQPQRTERRERQEQRQQRRVTRAPPRRQEAREAPPPPERTPPVTFESIPGMIVMSRDQYARSDVGRIARAPGPAAGSETAEAGGETTAGEPGAGPGGETLYPAEWYREPTRAETAPFMPENREGYGVIACRTAPRWRVEDCRELGETPGSGIARGLRRAAWQFLVRPPLKNGKPMMGVWVRIRYDLVRRSAVDAIRD